VAYSRLDGQGRSLRIAGSGVTIRNSEITGPIEMATLTAEESMEDTRKFYERLRKNGYQM
jgi:hypothetical protein